MQLIFGILFHSIGAVCAALCYTPQTKVRHWSWQTYWLMQALFCWLLLPIIVGLITVPDLKQVIIEAPRGSMIKTFLLGMAYGIGGTAFGIAIRYIGFSLTYAIAVGISCVFGTMLPPLFHGQLTYLFQQQGSNWMLFGIAFGALGIALCGIAGRLKELSLNKEKPGAQAFSLYKGLPLCFMAGLLSAVYGLAIDQGQPIAEVAVKHGAGNFQTNAIYIFSNSGAFLTTMFYCLYLHNKHHSFREYVLLKRKNSPVLCTNLFLSILTGCLWYAQFLFYGLGHIRMGNYKFTSWAIHMILLVLFSVAAGIIMREWSKSQLKTKWVLAIALMVLITSVVSLTYGNYITT